MRWVFRFFFFSVASIVLLALFLFVGKADPAETIRWGVTFGQSQTTSLGVEWQEAYLALLDDLGVRNIRIPIYWDELEPQRGAFDFAPWDWQLDELARRDGKAILAVGRKLPRWPECRTPPWFSELESGAQREALLTMLETVVRHYQDRSAVAAWQIENEPFLRFGRCPEPDPALLDEEIALVRRIDPSRPIVITDTGEFSAWWKAGKRADIIGSTLYRVIHDPTFGFIRYPFPPVMYQRKAMWIRRLHPDLRVIFTEVQAEPWVVDPPISRYPIETQFETMNPEQFRANIEFARNAGFDEIYLWGSEWWYWLKTQGEPEVWNDARSVFREAESAP